MNEQHIKQQNVDNLLRKEENIFPNEIFNYSQRGKEIVDDPGDAGEIYEAGTGYNALTME